MKLNLKAWHIATIALFTAACTAGAGGGVFGGALTAVIAGALLLAACGKPDDKNNEPNVQPCLTNGSIQYDGGNNNNIPDVGPCLQPLPLDMDIGPCLSPPFQDFGTPDAGSDAGSDAGPPAADMDGMGKLDIIDKLGERLPADVLARLADSDDQSA